ncbi:MAG: hypothetical protein V3R60_02855, partial [Acidobacteriota bacterium]
TTLDEEKGEIVYRWPQVLPGGKAVLFTVLARSVGEPYIEVQSLETGERKTLQQAGFYARYLPTGHLAYVREGTLFAAPFDLGRLEVTGPTAHIVEDENTSQGAESAQFDLSQTGTLVYLTGAAGGESTLVWVDREGKREPLLETPHNYSWPELSPDGRRLAVQIGGSNIDVWVHELSRNVLSRLTFAEGYDGAPVWTPDGERIAFRSSRDGGAANIYWKPADGSGEAERLTTSDNLHSPSSWSPDGKMMAFFELNPETGWDIWTLRLEGDRKPEPFLRTRFAELGLTFSPDGRWITYQSNESGRTEVYVRPFPGPGGKCQVSAGASRAPFQRWSHDGRELFYLNGNKMMVVPVRAGESFSAGTPQVLFEGSFGFGYDVTADGQRFVMVQPGEQTAATTQLNFVFNWFDEVRRRVASAGQN